MSEKEPGNKTVQEVNSSRSISPSDFDWDAFSNATGAGNYSTDDRSRMEDLYTRTLSTVQANEIVQGTVVSMNDRDVVINIGFKSDGMVPMSEFKDIADLKLGDTVEVLIVDQEDRNGQLHLSRKIAKLVKAWDKIVYANENDVIIEGRVKSRTKGGLVVEVEGVETFLPGSQIDVKPVRDYDQYVGKTMEFKVVKVNHVLKNAVVSHKILIENDIEAQKNDIISKLEKGQVLEGIVKNMTDFGTFIDLGGVDGLLHITDISWGRINHPSDVLSLDQKIEVVVLDFDDHKKRISLGMKQLTAHPWDSLTAELEVGNVVTGKIVTITDYGSFVEILPGVEGLIHVSEMSWSQHLRNPQDFHKVGDEVKAVILSIDREDRKMSLGIKQLSDDPWINISDKYPVGSRHKGIVRNLTNFGLFVELGEGVDGLVHVSDLSWTKKINHPAEFTKKDQELEVIVLDIDLQNRRLSLGHKQLEENPWEVFETIFLEGSIHQGTIVTVEDKGAIIAMPYGLEAYAPKKQLTKEDESSLVLDEQADFKIVEFNKDSRRIVVSHSRVWQDKKDDVRKAEETSVQDDLKKIKKKAKTVDLGTLAELDVLSEIKNKMIKSEKKAQSDAIDKMDAKMKEKDDSEEEA